MSRTDRHERFMALHGSGCFVMPNPWDAGSARMMAAMGAVALATSSAAHAFTLGRPDMGGVTRDEALAHAEDIVASTGLPVSGDFENGFGDTPEDVAETVRLAAEVGLSGCGIEDMAFGESVTAYDFELALEKIRAGVAAARSLGRPFVLTARADGVMNGVYDLSQGILRLQAFEAAGADCLYLPVPPGQAELAQILAAVKAPLNVLAVGPVQDMSLGTLTGLGVRRISLGSQMARLTHAAIRDAMAALQAGHFTPFKAAARGDEIDALLKGGRGDG
ncbi:isocitrate lyase/PEP mutase family protein [Gymnodinialimonas ulvae]|uniref:isocitrate lyase/PEP mutase family protein n=1 Tax=Gymnodinialimonas ulvae TaxID=3126504 RepID=UPI00309F4162